MSKNRTDLEVLPDHLLRIGDAERDSAIGALGDHFAAGRIDQDEFGSRTDAALVAKTRSDLVRLFSDLPQPAPFRPQDAKRRERRRSAYLPYVPLLLVILVIVSIATRIPFVLFPLFWFWFGWGRRGHFMR
jgi:hypothetical protein